MSRLFCLALVLFGLVGCGESGTSTTPPASAPNTNPTVAANPSSNTTSDPDATAPVASGETCGSVTVSGNPARASDANAARQAADCFVQAYQACRTATLTIQDTTNNLFRQFAIVPASNGCALQQALQTDPAAPPAIAACADARMENDTLVIESCSHLGGFLLTP